MKLQEYFKPLLKIAYDAGIAIKTIYQQDKAVDITMKSDHTPVTEADIAAHKIIKKALENITSDIPLLSEESIHIPFATRQKWSRYWLVDPLDGTKEFIHGTGEFTVNIALIEKHESVLGMVYVPMQDIFYFAAKGCGAFKQIGFQLPQLIHTRSVDEHALTIALSRRHGTKRLQVLLEHLPNIEIINLGSSLKSCMIAEGKADLYPSLGKTSEWDMAAAQCIVEEAGGALLDLDFMPLRYNTQDSLINPPLLVVGDTQFDWQSIFKKEEFKE